jgi:hypothetical protein
VPSSQQGNPGQIYPFKKLAEASVDNALERGMIFEPQIAPSQVFSR